MYSDAERMFFEGSYSLDALARFSNGQLVIGKCDCDPECLNVNVTLWRLPQDDDKNSDGKTYPVASASAPELWEAALAVHQMLVQILDSHAAKEAARDVEIEILKAMWEQR